MSTRTRIEILEGKMEQTEKRARDLRTELENDHIVNVESNFYCLGGRISLLELSRRQSMILDYLGVDVVHKPSRELLKKKKKAKNG